MITALFATGAAGGGQRAALGIDESSPLTALLQIGTWTQPRATHCSSRSMALVGLAIMVNFLREGRDGFHWWKTFVAPILGAGAISFAFYLMMKYRAGITFGAYEGWVKAVPYISAGTFLGGCAARAPVPVAVEGTLRGRREVRARRGLGVHTHDPGGAAESAPPCLRHREVR